MSLLRRSIRIWRYRERLEQRFGPGVLIAFFWRHFVELDALLAAPIVGNQAGEKLRRSLLRDHDKLFVFLAEQDVPPTNNTRNRRCAGVPFSVRSPTASAPCGGPSCTPMCVRLSKRRDGEGSAPWKPSVSPSRDFLFPFQRSSRVGAL